ncbi:MAG: helix-turn-helix domain-containing protein [Nitrospirae bacterium]|nr:helix-turn-helix domain-containing protein [Nitrospirota bacterium]
MTNFIDNFTTNVIERIKLAYELKSDRSLCKRLNIKAGTLSKWKIRDTIDLRLVLSGCQDLNYDWVIKGIGNMFSEQPPNASTPEDIPKEHIKAFLDTYWSTANNEERNWLKVQFQRCFPEYKDWLTFNKLI